MGAATNAATSKESTQLHARLLDEHTEEAFDLLAEMLLRPSLPEDEVDSERQVVLEEIAMYEDEPQERVHDVLGGRRPRRPSAGAPGARRRRGDRLDPGRRDHLLPRRPLHGAEPGGRRGGAPRARARSSSWPSASSGRRPASATAFPTTAEPDAEPRFAFQAKETEQYHICFGGPGIARADERRFALGVLDAIFGGSTSSRLFREVREKRGLAYAVGSYSEQYVDCGMVAMYVGTREENVREACEIIGRELETLRDHGVSAEELERAKEHVKGRMVLGLEATGRAHVAACPRDPVRRPAALARRDARADRARSAPTMSPSWPPSCMTRSGSPPPASGPNEEHFREAAAAAVSEALATAAGG